MVQTQELKKIYLFQDMTETELNPIAALCISREVISGQDIFFSGQKAESFFVIQRGTIHITKTTTEGDDVQLTTLASGGHFGEIAFLTDDERTATAQAAESTTLIEIPYAPLRALLEKNPGISDKFHRSLARFLAGRLKSTSSDYALVKEMVLRHL